MIPLSFRKLSGIVPGQGRCFAAVLLLLPLFLFTSCLKKENFPDTPIIEYVSFTKIQNGSGVDNKATLTLKFSDGNGDIGLAAADTFSPFNVGSPWYYNFFITYYEMQKGVLTKVDLPFTNNSRIPPLSDFTREISIKGTIEMELFINNISSSYDTIAFEASIADRALNMSNTIRTPLIVVKKL